MTIEDLIVIHDERVARLEHFLRAVRLGRTAEESAVVRQVRRRLIGEIGQMLVHEVEARDADLEYLFLTTPGQRAADESAEPGCWEAEDRFPIDFDAVPLLDSAPVFADDGRAFDPAMGTWYHVEAGYPKKVSIPMAELGDLGMLIEEIATQLGISFTLERHFWTENTLDQWVLANETPMGTASVIG